MSNRETTENELEHAEAEHAGIEHAEIEQPRAEPSRPAAPPAPPLSREVRYAPPPVPKETPQQVRTPFLAAFFGLFPGLGNVYNGLYLRGITFFLIVIGLITVAQDTRPPETVLLIFAIIFTWLFSIFDAYRQATLINYGYAPDLEMPDKPRFSGWGSGGLTAGVAVFLLGLYGLLRDRFDLDLSLLVDYWYLLFMIFGAFLIAWTLIQRNKPEEGETGSGGLDL